MGRCLALIVGVVALIAPGRVDDAMVVVEETRTLEKPAAKAGARRSPPRVRHVARLLNASPHGVRGLRVTVELYDYFGKLLWSGSGAAVPSTLRPGETASVTLLTPDLESYRSTRYRFDYRGGGAR
jgi:hypothetical protein